MTIEPILNPPEILLSDTDELDENILFTDCNLVNIMNYKNKTYLVYDEEIEITLSFVRKMVQVSNVFVL